MVIDVPSEEQVPGTAVGQGLRLYRGLSSFERVQHARGVVRIRPQVPLRARAQDWLDFDGVDQSDAVRLLHVLEHVREHAVSFSGTLAVAQYYATSDHVHGTYCKPGLVAEVSLADPTQAVGVGGKPIVWVFSDGTAWLDPRALVAQTVVQEKNSLACVTMQHRAQVDDELLLVHGEVRVSSVFAVLPTRICHRHVPWKAIEQVRGVDVSQVPDLTDDDEDNVLSIFGSP